MLKRENFWTAELKALKFKDLTKNLTKHNNSAAPSLTSRYNL